MTAVGVRYGVFLRPDAATCWNVTQVTLALRQQFGFVSAGAFPPHATLVGNLATEATPEGLTAALDPVFAATTPFPVRNAGLARSTGHYYDIDSAAVGEGRNRALVDLAAAVKAAVLPLSIPADDHLVTGVAAAEFFGHIGVASHELIVGPHLLDEVGEFLETLPIAPPPSRFDARWCALYRFEADWAGEWWRALTWQHLRSWHLA